jgi:hypothetical protein
VQATAIVQVNGVCGSVTCPAGDTDDDVTIRALTFEGQRAVAGVEDDLGSGRHPASPLFYAAHEVITQRRLVEESRQAR